MKVGARILLLLLSTMMFASAASAQRSRSQTDPVGINTAAVGVISGGANGTYIRIAADLATVLDSDNLRILPIIGRGSLQNLKDIMFLRGIDIGIVQMDAREALIAEGLQSEAERRLRYIARLYNEEFHLLAGKNVASIRDLDGKKVNIDVPGSGTNLTARLIFGKLGVKPEFTTFDQASSYEKLRNGEVQAAVYVAGRPVRAISEFTGGGRFHLLDVPFDGDVAESYLPAELTVEDYPQLVEAATPVKTVAVGSILAVFNWNENSDRYRRIERFVEAFFSRFGEFQQPGRHPKWKDVSLAASVPGWKRFAAAQQWLDTRTTGAIARQPVEQDFAAYMATRRLGNPPNSPKAVEALYRGFLVWSRERSLRP